MPDTPGFPDAREVVRNRRKLVAIKRAEFRYKQNQEAAKFRLGQRLKAIDHELDVVQPALAEFEKTIVTQGELPEFHLVDDDD